MNMNSYDRRAQNIPPKKQFIAQLRLLKLLADANRLELLAILDLGEHCVSELVAQLKRSQSLVSHHLADLRTAGLVNRDKRGRYAYYSLSREGRAVMVLLERATGKSESLSARGI